MNRAAADWDSRRSVLKFKASERDRESQSNPAIKMFRLEPERISDYTLRQIQTMAENHLEWLRPRWPARVQVWRELLLAAEARLAPAAAPHAGAGADPARVSP